MNTHQIVERLSEAIAWCEPRASVLDPINSLRRAAFTPARVRSEYESLLGDDRHASVDQLCASRREMLRVASDLGNPRGFTLRGWLLGYEPDLQLRDGACQIASNGLFDEYDCPPWDTWVSWVDEGRGYLLSWIPPAFVDLTDAAIEACSSDCIWWVDSRYATLRDELTRVGVVQG